jgi:hypothetical protein
MTVKEAIVDKMVAAGYDFWSACEHTDQVLAEFLASGEDQYTFGIMGANGKCVDTVGLIRRK